LNAVAKTAKLIEIRKTIDKVYEIYSKGCKEGLPEVTKILKIRKFTKAAKTNRTRKSFYKVYEIYSKSCREVSSKATRTAKMRKFTETETFLMICSPSTNFAKYNQRVPRKASPNLDTKIAENSKIYENYEIYNKLPAYHQLQKIFSKLREQRNFFKATRTAKFEICDNVPAHPRITRNLFKGLQGRRIQSYENCENYQIYENCEIYDNSQS